MVERTKQLTEACVNSLNNNSRLRNIFKQADEPQRRVILSTWYVGFTEGLQKAEGTSKEEIDNLPSENQFIEASLPSIHKAVAA